MGASTNGIICYGIKFEEGFEFPWDAEPWDGEIEEWWGDVNGYKPPFELYDAAGNYHPTIRLVTGRYPSDTRPEDETLVERYHAHRLKWDEAHPLPVELENYCSAECPMYILAVRGVGLLARRGYAEQIHLTLETPQQLPALLAFCKAQKIRGGDGPKWWLCSYWG